MDAEKDKQLCEKYPKIFADRHKPMVQTAMCWGFECCDGWYDLIDTLCGVIQHHIDQSVKNRERALEKQKVFQEARDGNWESFNHYYKGFDELFLKSERERVFDEIEIPDEVSQVVASQVKEKFGGLNFYYYGGDAYIDGAVSFAESMSYRICEKCGSPGSRRGGGWIVTLCDRCHSKKD